MSVAGGSLKSQSAAVSPSPILLVETSVQTDLAPPGTPGDCVEQSVLTILHSRLSGTQIYHYPVTGGEFAGDLSARHDLGFLYSYRNWFRAVGAAGPEWLSR